MNRVKPIGALQRVVNRVFWIPILALEVTDRCNSRCVMCDIWKNADGHEPDGERVEHLILGLKKKGLRHILVTGGEPLARQDIFEFCDRLSRHNVQLILNTNGLQLEEYANEVSGRFDLVIVSLDSHDRGVYKDIRGCDEFPNVVAGIKRLKEQGGRVMLSHTLQKRNVDGLTDFIAFSRSLGVDRVSLRQGENPAGSDGRPDTGRGGYRSVHRPAREDRPGLSKGHPGWLS